MKILVDTNILLDVAQRRTPHFEDSDRVVRWCEAHPRCGFVAWHTIATVYYILERDIGNAGARQFIVEVLDIFEVAQTSTALAKHALHLPIADYEDALQIVAGIVAGVDVIVTRNERDYVGSTIEVRNPRAFIDAQEVRDEEEI